MRGRLEDRKVFEVGKERKDDLSADVGDLQFGHGQAEMFYGSRATGASVADKPDGLLFHPAYR